MTLSKEIQDCPNQGHRLNALSPRFGLFFYPHFFFWKLHLHWLKRILRRKKISIFFPVKRPYPGGVRGGILSPRIWAVRATFKAVLMAVDMSGTLQTKCKTCFGCPRMILQAHWKNTFSKKQFGFFITLGDPPPGFGKRPYFSRDFFLEPFPKVNMGFSTLVITNKIL